MTEQVLEITEQGLELLVELNYGIYTLVGMLLFIILVILLRYTYKFFRMFIW